MGKGAPNIWYLSSRLSFVCTFAWHYSITRLDLYDPRPHERWPHRGHQPWQRPPQPTAQPLSNRWWNSGQIPSDKVYYHLQPLMDHTPMSPMVTALPVRSYTSPTRDSSRTSTIGGPSIALSHQPPRKSLTTHYSVTSTRTPPTIWVWHPAQTLPSTCSIFTMWPTPTPPRSYNANTAKSGLPSTSWCRCTQSSFIAMTPTPTCFAGDASKQPMAVITWSTQVRGSTRPRNPRMPTWPQSLTFRWYPIDRGPSNP